MDRKLDLKIAKEILGWKDYEPVGSDYNGKNSGEVLVPHKGYLKGIFEQGFTFPSMGKISESFFVPHYTADFLKAFELAKKVKLPNPIFDCPSTAHDLAEMAYNYFKSKEVKDGA